MVKIRQTKAAVLSDGGWGTALALLLDSNGCDVTLWGAFPDYIALMKAEKENCKFLPGVRLPETLSLSGDMEQTVRDAEIVVMAAPTQYSRNVLEILKKYFNPDSQILVNVAKGIENSTLMRISEICRDVLGDISYCVLSGPSHAEEVARNCPTAVAAASDDIKVAEKTQKIFMADFFRVYTSQDIISVELGGALKNVMAIASGVVDGMKTGDNAKAALITRGIAEMSRLGAALGGNRDTFAGLSGTGDLIVTCMSGHSRNRHVGEELGRGRKLEKILADMGMSVAEGVKTTKSAYELALANNVETPIINEVYNVLYKGRDPSEALNYLMTRNARHELD